MIKISREKSSTRSGISQPVPTGAVQSSALPGRVGFTADPNTCLGAAQGFWVDGSQTREALQWFCSFPKERNPLQIYPEGKKTQKKTQKETTHENHRPQTAPGQGL